MFSSSFTINLRGTEKLSEEEREAVKWYQILQQCEGDFRTLGQTVLPALKALGTENPGLIFESVKLLCSSKFLGSLSIMTARSSAGCIRELIQAIPQVASYVKENHIEYIKIIQQRRAKVDSNDWRGFSGSVVEILTALDTTPLIVQKQTFFPPKTSFDIYGYLRTIMSLPEKTIQLLDPFADINVIGLVASVPEGIKIQILARDDNDAKRQDLLTGGSKYKQQYGNIEVRLESSPFTQHDRYIIIDRKRVFEVGPSINHAGEKTGSVVEWDDKKGITAVINNFDSTWSVASQKI